MDGSQNADVFRYASETMDTDLYEALICKTKAMLCKDWIKIVSSAEDVAVILDDVGSCIAAGLNLVLGLLENAQVQFSKLVQYLEDAIYILQMLSNFIKRAIDTVAVSYCTMGALPCSIGRILLLVFSHCKNSEGIYRSYLKHVEKQLKDLFRTCHELQLTYLTILEKHFVFDLSETKEMEVLIEALDINLKIGELVQSLDAKTMAEQWKAYIAICEKYSQYLVDKKIYNKCTKILCTMILENMNMALEDNQEEKVLMRSLKVTSFTIKILLKLCRIFKYATAKNYECVLDVLIYIYLHNSAYLSMEKSPQFVNLITTLVLNVTDGLLTELLSDEVFCKYLLQFDAGTLNKDENLLGYIILIISCMKFWSKTKDDEVYKPKEKLIVAVFDILPYAYECFNMPLKFNSYTKGNQETYGLYTHLLVHTAVYVNTLNSNQYNVLEENMYESILGIDFVKAQFAVDLWVLMSRIVVNYKLVFDQLLTLCQTYQKLENHKLFPYSLQHTNLCYIIGKFYEILPDKDKIQLYKQISPYDDTNIDLWTSLRISNLPKNLKPSVEEVVKENCSKQFQKLLTSNIYSVEDMNKLIRTVKLAATCSFSDCDDTLEEFVIKTWSKSCLKSNIFKVPRTSVGGMMWYLEFMEALVAITNAICYIFHKDYSNIVKVLHTISGLLETKNVELNLILIDLLCKISTFQISDDCNPILVKSFKLLFKDDKDIVKYKFLSTLRKYIDQENTRNVIDIVISDDQNSLDSWNNFNKSKNIKCSMDWKDSLNETIYCNKVHKCITNSTENTEKPDKYRNIEKRVSGNFDFADIDTLLHSESDTEPDCKKAKLDPSEAKAIIDRLENDVYLLSNVKENVFSDVNKNRIRDLCCKLKNIVD